GGVVDRNDRDTQRAVALHGAQADDAGGGLLHAGAYLGGVLGVLGVQQRDQIGAVIHGQHRLLVEHGAQVTVVRVVVFALDRVGRDALVLDQRRGGVVLGGERIGGAQEHLGAAGLERPHQVGGLGGDRHAET